MSFNWKQLVGSVAPALATALGGPLAGMATKAISSAVLGKDSGSEMEITEAIIAGGPDTLLKLKEADQSFSVEMKKLDINLEEISAKDRDSARRREIETKDNAPKILAAVIVTGFFAVLGVIAFVPLPAGAQAPVNILLGSLTALLLQVGNYYFGSSAGSSKKNEMMAKLVNN